MSALAMNSTAEERRAHYIFAVTTAGRQPPLWRLMSAELDRVAQGLASKMRTTDPATRRRVLRDKTHAERRSDWRHSAGLDGNGHGQIEPPTPAL